MPDRRDFLLQLAAVGAVGAMPRTDATPPVPALSSQPGRTDREYWVNVLTRIARPVLDGAAAGQLRARMPVELAPAAPPDRREYAQLEAFGRLLTGIAPWLELGPDATAEGRLRGEYALLARRGLTAVTDPRSPDYANFTRGRQPLVDAAFLAHAIVRAPRQLWQLLDPAARPRVVAALKATRTIQPPQSNWLLFSAMIEAALCTMGEEWDRLRVDYAVRQHEQWYKGDGIYGDGAAFHWDYYNSFVIQPMLVDILRAVSASTREWEALVIPVRARARRYAAIQERMISPEGTYPPIGRSLAYRFGAFQLLAQMALQHQLPEDVSPAQVRGALSAVIRRTIEAPGTFNAGGWLTIGICGHQPHVGESYISTGSTYLCSAGLLPLGLPASDEFWSAPPAEWTARRVWAGQDLGADHAL
ncbi:MAG: DUF2264 domain-containing protein [Gemmatimonadaceae bacterium]